jgi:precorrin-8X/cobalt-precorrin-8 methylmutase
MSMSAGYDYARDDAEIYRRSFAIIRSEADLSRFTKDEVRVAVRVIHACGMVEVARDLVFSPGFVPTAGGALLKGKRIFCDSKMVANGITRARLPADNDIVCTLDSPDIADRAARLDTTRSAAALDLWLDNLGGSLVTIGNAPTALFRLLELINQGAPKPAAVIGMPVGFVGAAESKEALARQSAIPSLIVKGRKGGSAMAVATVNALASEAE